VSAIAVFPVIKFGGMHPYSPGLAKLLDDLYLQVQAAVLARAGERPTATRAFRNHWEEYGGSMSEFKYKPDFAKLLRVDGKSSVVCT
jgi:hypothetical protein